MISAQFDALMRTPDGKILEYGVGQVDSDHQAVEFWGEFVPLLRMGETAQVVRLIGGQEAHIFTGTVYLSSPRLLRLVSITDQVLTPALSLSVEVQLPAQVLPLTEAPRRFPFLPKQKRTAGEATVYTLSVEGLSFRSPQVFQVGEHLRLTALGEEPLLDAEVVVNQVFVFGAEGAGHRCSILGLTEEARTRLLAHIGQVQRLFATEAQG